MKLFRLTCVVALLLAGASFSPSASAQQEGWWYVKTTYDGLPYHTRADLGQGNYRPTVIDYDVWSEGNAAIAFKENYVGSYFVLRNITNAQGRMDSETHNHQGEYASAVIHLPQPPAVMLPGQDVRLSMSVDRSTNCGWSSRPEAALGTVYVKAGSTTLASFDTNRNSSTTFSVHVGSGTNGAQLQITFLTLLAGKQESATYHFVYGNSQPSGSSGGGSGSLPSTDDIPEWVWWAGGALILLLLFGRKKK